MNLIIISPDRNMYQIESPKIYSYGDSNPLPFLVQCFSKNTSTANNSIAESIKNYNMHYHTSSLDKKDNKIKISPDSYGLALFDFIQKKAICLSYHKVPLFSITLNQVINALSQDKSEKRNKFLLDFLYLYNNGIFTTRHSESQSLAKRLSNYIQNHCMDINNIPAIRKDPFISSRLDISLKYNRQWNTTHTYGDFSEKSMLYVIEQIQQHNVLINEEQIQDIADVLYYSVDNFNKDTFFNKVLSMQEKEILTGVFNTLNINNQKKISKL